MKKITKYELEEALSKLLFNVSASIYYKPYLQYQDAFIKILNILNVWVSYYVENGNLLKMSDEEVNNINNAFNSIPFDAYNGEFYEEVDTWLTVVIFYGSCPIGIEFDENMVTRKGKKHCR